MLWFGTFSSGLVSFDERRVTRYSAADGLAHNHCSSVLIDSQSNLWFTTSSNGVSRWDGRRFQNFITAHGLPNSSVYAIQQDRAGLIWFGTGKWLARWDGKRFESYSPAASRRGFRIDHIFYGPTPGPGVTLRE